MIPTSSPPPAAPAATIAIMSSPGSSNSPATMEEEPRKKGSRGGKRSVTHLSKAQLARKRANDREAQRNIRQRTKEHIENLEKKVKELEDYGRAGSMERVMKRNKELEMEIEKLRIQLAAHSAAVRSESTTSEEMLLSRKISLEWMTPEGRPASGWQPAHVQPLDAHAHDIPVTNGAYTSNPSQVFHNALPAMCYEQQGEPEPQTTLTPALTPVVTPVWEDPMVFGQTSQVMEQPTPAWAPFHPAFNQPSRFADLQQAGFSDIPNQPNSTCWQSQPSVYAWQISTKLKAPVTLVDQLMFSVIHSQRHLSLHSDLSGEGLLGPNFPSVHLLFNQPGPVSTKPPSNLAEVMNRYAQVLSNRGFALIPEKLASFMCMYRFVQWQISPSQQTFQKLHDWQAPRPAQLMIPHPAWMDLPPWGKFREKVIENQDRYDNPQFQEDYASNLSVNFPHDPMKAMIFENGQIMVSPLLERHLSDIRNMSMKKPFADKYPEFRDVCRFEEL